MKKTIDLNPKGVTKEELEEVRTLNQHYATIKGRVADAALIYKRSVDMLDSMENKLSDMQNTLAKKYGEGKQIDLSTGKFK